MKTIQLSLVQSDSNSYSDIVESLAEGNIVCFPSPSGYKLAADFTSPRAILGMIQAKRRVKNAPSLVLVPNEEWVDTIASRIPDDARTLMKAFWPGPLTLLMAANQELPAKIRKSLTGATGWLGVRIPDDEISMSILRAFNKPLLVSSANLARKRGAHSVQQIKKNFGRTVDILVDAGDLPKTEKSTLVDVTQTQSAVVRAGLIPEKAIMEALSVA